MRLPPRDIKRRKRKTRDLIFFGLLLASCFSDDDLETNEKGLFQTEEILNT
jgi:hypothetical protein